MSSAEHLTLAVQGGGGMERGQTFGATGMRITFKVGD
jgi:hypothetical protein